METIKIFITSTLELYGIFYFYLLVLGPILVSILVEWVKERGFRKSKRDPDPALIWFVAFTASLGYTLLLAYELPCPGGLVLSVVHAFVLYGLQYLFNQKVVHRLFKALANHIINKAERLTLTDINEDGTIAGQAPEVARNE